jgi:hypothetical protein
MLETLKAHGRIEDSLLDSINAYLASMAQVSPAAVAATAAAPEKPKCTHSCLAFLMLRVLLTIVSTSQC